MTMQGEIVAADILHGAAEIAQFVFGSSEHRRRVYYLIETAQLPYIRLSKARICARRSALREWLASREIDASPGDIAHA